MRTSQATCADMRLVPRVTSLVIAVVLLPAWQPCIAEIGAVPLERKFVGRVECGGEAARMADIGILDFESAEWADFAAAEVVVRSDENGTFELRTVKHAGADVVVRAQGCAPQRRPLAEIVDHAAVVFRLDRAVGIDLSVSPCEYPHAVLADGGRFFHSVSLADDCVGELDGISIGPAMLWMSSDGVSTDGSPHQFTITNEANQRVKVELWGTEVHGIVTNGNRPVIAEIVLRRLDGIPEEFVVWSEDSGRFAIKEIRPGNYRVRASVGERTTVASLHLMSGRTIELKLRLGHSSEHDTVK